MKKYDLATLKAADLNDDELVMQMYDAKYLDTNKEAWLDFTRKGLLGSIRASSDWTKEMLADLQAECPIPVFVTQNAETGAEFGVGLRRTRFPMQMTVGATGSVRLAYEWARAIGLEMCEFGTNWALGPVLDLAIEPDSTGVGNRSFGADPEQVAKMGAAAVRGFQDCNLLVSVKHFPGKGRAKSDTHIIEYDIDVPLNVLDREELYPYRYAIEHADLSGIMPSHLKATALDTEETGVTSKAHLDHLLAMGFKGLFITDSIAMGAMTAKYGPEERVVKPIEAGNHIVIGDPRIAPEDVLGYLRAAMKSGRLSRKMIEPRVDQILDAKRRVILSPPQDLPDYDMHEKLAREIATRAITEYRKPGIPAGVDTSKKLFVLIVTEEKGASGEPEVQLNAERQGEVAHRVRERLPNALIREIPMMPSSGNIAGCLRQSLTETDRTIVLASATVHAFKGIAHLTRPIVNLLDGLASRIDSVVMFGNPYAALDLPEVPRVIFAYRGEHTTEAAINVLFGDAEAKGKLPVPAVPPGF
ncbi:MAG: hypothetical protein KAH23_03070 [Kiritimatiellae bacterium]|nr:hypothetical protein [Kiritimatiellia bacterium]